MFKVEDVETPFILTAFFNIILNVGRIPSEWKKGIIVKIPKKGQLSDCGNWRGITLSPIALKIFSKLLNRMEPVIDEVLNKQLEFLEVAVSSIEFVVRISTFTI